MNNYVKLADGTKIDVIDLNFYCKCPVCGREVAVPEFFEFFENENFDPYDSNIYCDDCSKESHRIKQTMSDLYQDEDALLQAVHHVQKTMHRGIIA